MYAYMCVYTRDQFEGVVDLVKLKAIYWEEENMGIKFEEKIYPKKCKVRLRNITKK